MSIQNVGSIGELIATTESLVGQQSLDLGYSDLDSRSALDLLAPVVRELLETDAGARWWKEAAPHLYIDEFRAQVDEAIARTVVSE